STTSSGTVVNTGGNDFRVDAPTHTYAEEGTYTVTVTVKHESAAAQTTHVNTITTNEVQITNLTDAGASQTIDEGGSTAAITGIATYTDTASAEPAAHSLHAALPIYSTTSSGTVVNTGGNDFRVDAPTHTYAEEGTYTVTVTVKHES